MKSKRTNMLMTISAMMAALSKNFTQVGYEATKEANTEFMASSRGKGRGGGLSARRIFSKHTNSRKPHQGYKECARRRESLQ
jgi:hypothetical protein